jgi:spore coat protein CotF
LFEPDYVRRLIQEQLSRTKDNREQLWTLLVFQTWYDRYLNVARPCHD